MIQATLASALTFAVVAVIAYRRPQALKAQAIVGIALACTLVLMVGMAFALSAHNIWLVAVGFVSRSVGRSLTILLVALCLVRLKSSKEVAFAVALGAFISSVVELFSVYLATPLSAAFAVGAIQAVTILWACKPAKQVLDVTAKGDPVETLQLADPNAFLSPVNGVFICMLLVWGVVTALGRRNVYGYVAVVAIMKLMDSLGTLLGAVSGHLTNDFVQTDFFMATGFALTMVFLFFAFLWCGFRNFSFNDTIESVTSVAVPVSEPIEQPAEEPASEPVLTVQDVLDRNCEEIGARCGLTEREREIFTMMAHGRNGRYVMEHFVISRNTAKSHIKHIYAKLGVHSHQELIDLAAGVSRDAE